MHNVVLTNRLASARKVSGAVIAAYAVLDPAQHARMERRQ